MLKAFGNYSLRYVIDSNKTEAALLADVKITNKIGSKSL